MKSVKPPRTKNGALGFRRGCKAANEGSDTVAVMRVSFPTLPHLRYCQHQASTYDMREGHT